MTTGNLWTRSDGRDKKTEKRQSLLRWNSAISTAGTPAGRKTLGWMAQRVVALFRLSSVRRKVASYTRMLHVLKKRKNPEESQKD